MNPPPVALRRSRLTIIFPAVLLVLFSAGLARAQQADSGKTFESLLTEMSSAPGDSCNSKSPDFSHLEYRLFERAGEAIVLALNNSLNTVPGSPNSSPSTPKAQALDALATLERQSAEINKSWPEENRFHFAALEISPTLVVKMTFRNRATITAFGIPRLDPQNKPNSKWRAVYVLDSGRFDPRSGYDSVELFPLQRGPSGKPRFLAKFLAVGCGSGVGVSYYAYEWSVEDSGDFKEIIKLESSESQEDPIDKLHPSKKDLSGFFPPIGELHTDGPRITLPHCWYSEIDTWDNPSLCAVDSYDVSSNQVRFVSRVTNRPDLVPVATVIKYAHDHDYLAVLGYCGSADVAQKIVRDLPPFIVAASGLKVSRLGAAKERVEIGDESTFRFDVERRGTRWLVVAFQFNSN